MTATLCGKGVAAIGAARGRGIVIAGVFAERDTLALIDIDAERAPEMAASLAGSEGAVALVPDSGQILGTQQDAVEADLLGAGDLGQASGEDRTS